jgi:hypothetical protein
MRRVGEHVDRLHRADVVLLSHDQPEIARERLRITRHVDRAPRPRAAEHAVDHPRRAAFARRIEDDDVSAGTGERLFDRPGDESNPIDRQPIQPGADLAVGDRRAILLDGDDTVAAARQRDGEEPGAGIEIEHVGVLRHRRQRERDQRFSGTDVGLKERRRREEKRGAGDLFPHALGSGEPPRLAAEDERVTARMQIQMQPGRRIVVERAPRRRAQPLVRVRRDDERGHDFGRVIADANRHAAQDAARVGRNLRSSERIAQPESEPIPALVVHRALACREHPPRPADVVSHRQARPRRIVRGRRSEHEVHLVPVAPRIALLGAGDRRQGRGRVRYRGSYEPIDERGLQTQLLRIRDVLPGAPAAVVARPEVRAPRHDAVR